MGEELLLRLRLFGRRLILSQTAAPAMESARLQTAAAAVPAAFAEGQKCSATGGGRGR